jgi:hypothetical protein
MQESFTLSYVPPQSPDARLIPHREAFSRGRDGLLRFKARRVYENT